MLHYFNFVVNIFVTSILEIAIVLINIMCCAYSLRMNFTQWLQGKYREGDTAEEAATYDIEAKNNEP